MSNTSVDGRWAWIVAFSSFWTMLMCYSIQRTAGVLYIAMMSVYNTTREEAAWPFYLRKTVAMFTTNVVGVLVRKFSIRSQIIVGIIFCALGLASLYFVNNILSVTLLFGILYGLGSGIVDMCNIIAINQSFCRYRTVAFGIMASGSPTGAFVFPPLIEYAIKEYGLRGTYLLLTGIVLQSFIVVTLYRVPQNQDVSNNNTKSVKVNCTNERITSHEEESQLEKPKVKGNLCGDTIKLLSHIIRIPMFHVCWFSYLMFDFTFYTFLTVIVDYGIDCGIQTYKVVFLLSASSITEFCGRVGVGWIIDLKLMKRKNVITASFLIKGALFLAMPFLKGYVVLLILTAVIGILGSCLIINYAAVFAEYVGLDYLPLCVSISCTFNGLLSLITPRIIGYIRDTTGSYNLFFYVSATCLLLSAVLWLLEPLFSKERK